MIELADSRRLAAYPAVEIRQRAIIRILRRDVRLRAEHVDMAVGIGVLETRQTHEYAGGCRGISLSRNVPPLGGGELLGMIGEREEIETVRAGGGECVGGPPLAIGVPGVAMKIAEIDVHAGAVDCGRAGSPEIPRHIAC